MQAKSTFIICMGMLTFFNACGHKTPFNRDRWLKKEADWEITDTREQMIHDLITNYLTKGKTKSEVVGLLGTPDKEHKNQLLYLVREKYSWNIDPEYISYLVIDLDRSNTIEKVGVQRNVWRKLKH